MKICITTSGNNLDSPVDPRFGRCPFFLIVDPETKKFEVLKNSSLGFARGAGIAAAQLIAGQKVEAVITGGVGPNAFMALNSTGIKIYPGVSGMTAKQALDVFNQGKLQEATTPTTPGHFGMPGGAGLGPGRGRGRIR